MQTAATKTPRDEAAKQVATELRKERDGEGEGELDAR